MLYLTVASMFISTAMLTGVVLYLVLARRFDIIERLEKIVPKRELPNADLLRKQTPLQLFMSNIGKTMPLNTREQSKYTRYLVAAGYGKESLYFFLGAKMLLAVGFPLLFIVFVTLPSGMILNSQMLLLEIALLIIGFLAPSFWLQRKVKYRSTEIFHTLPDILDLLTICVEAGISIDAAMVKATENPQFKGNPLTEELKQATLETRAGKQRSDALRDMAQRTMVDDVKSFVTMIIQTERFGTSLSQALRVHSDSLRTKRRQMAEEAAAKTSIKMLIPLVFFVFPAILIIILGPALISISKALK